MHRRSILAKLRNCRVENLSVQPHFLVPIARSCILIAQFASRRHRLAWICKGRYYALANGIFRILCSQEGVGGPGGFATNYFYTRQINLRPLPGMT
jgi:hypothetical protein